MEYILLENQLSPEDFIRLKVETFWERPVEQVKQALDNGLFNINTQGMSMMMDIK